MALIDTGTDEWLSEYDASQKLYTDITKQLNERDSLPRTSTRYNGLSAAIRIQLKQFSSELNQLEASLEISTKPTHQEKERRKRLIEDLQSKNVQLNRLFRVSPEKRERKQLMGDEWFDEESDSPLLGEPSDKGVDELKREQARILLEQDKGLDNLSSIIARQKNIAITIDSEVSLHNDILDDIGDRMSSVHSNIQRETNLVTTISNSDSTCGYWIVILSLFAAILGISILF